VQVPQVAKDFMLQSVAKAQVAINLAQQHGLPAAMVEHLRRASYDSFIAASHITTWVSVGVILVAVIIVATQLPTEVSHSHRDDEIAAQEAAMPPVVAD
jgi:hypothetical protein